MGCFDSVHAQCECGETIEFQSKAGKCELRVYDISSVPLAIADDLNGESEVCPECGVIVEINILPNNPNRIMMYEDYSVEE